MKKPEHIFLLCSVFLLCSCAALKKNYDPAKKYPRKDLQEDYALLRNILEKKHPSLYWYTPKDSMDLFFEKYYRAIEDSMTEQQFGWKILAPLTAKIRCGHTSFGMSRGYNKWANNKRMAGFPVYLKFWNDTMAVTVNLNRKDSVLKRGTLVTAVNGLRYNELVKTMFGFMTMDGSADNVNFIRVSNNFPYFHRNIFGLSRQYTVNYLDNSGKEQVIHVPLFEFPKDSTLKTGTRAPVKKRKKETRQQRLRSERSLAIDTTSNTAVITLNTFSHGGLRKFYRQTFRYIRKSGITSIVLDLRNNGGGRIGLSTLLTRYVTRLPFRVADSSYAVSRSLRPYTRYIQGRFFNNIGLFFLTRKKQDGNYHFGLWERKMYMPRVANHFNGDLYVLTNGTTFSASALFCNAVKGQPGVLLAGEDTGGGWYGNDGIMIPDITLPNTRLKVRLPLFRLVQYHHIQKNGSGIRPDVYIGTSYEALVKGYDKKMQVVMGLIKKKNAETR